MAVMMIERRQFLWASGAVTVTLAATSLSPGRTRNPDFPRFSVERITGNPIIHLGMSERLQAEAERYGYVNINGPSLIRVPAWVERPLGRYYLYFGHHKGEFIRLAYADEIGGPWRIYEPGALGLSDSGFPTCLPGGKRDIAAAVTGAWRRNPPGVAWALTRVGLGAMQAVAARKADGSYGSDEDRPHIASPEVIVDEEQRRIRMYFHGMLEDSVQMTRVALSPDGIHFEARPELLSSPYLRVFRFRGRYYGIGMPGILYRSLDGLSAFAARPGLLFGVNLRHTAVLLRGSDLFIFFSRVGDAPERILCATMDLADADWRNWRPSRPFEVLRPELPWEGAGEPVSPSLRGEITRPVNQLRDPAIFQEAGQTYLIYAGAGEQAIGMARLTSGAFPPAGR